MMTLNAHDTCGSLFDIARQAAALGMSVVPPRENGSKAPIGEWKRFQSIRADDEQIRNWYGTRARTGIGVVCGAVSSNLELLEFETAEIWSEFTARAKTVGLDALLVRVFDGYAERAPGGGTHLLYRCSPVQGNTKLAATADRKTLIETRGEGGYVIVAPTSGSVHPSGMPYTLVSGGFDTIATITAEERDELWDLARSFDESARKTARELASPDGATKPANGSRPGDAFAAGTSWAEILEPAGWTLVYEVAGEQFWRRPGKSIGISATTNHHGNDRLYVFSTSTVLEPATVYTKFAAYAVLNHDGDFHAAAKELRAQGFGTTGVTGDGDDGSTSAATPILRTPAYRATDQGMALVKHTDGGVVLEALSNFRATIVADVVHDDGMIQDRFVEIQLNFAAGPDVKAVVPVARFGEVRAWAMEAAGTRALVYPGNGKGEHLRAAIQTCSTNVAHKEVLTSTGWRTSPTGQRFYVHAGGTIGTDHDGAAQEITLRSPLDRYALPAVATGTDLINAINASLAVVEVAPTHVTIPLLGAVYRSVLDNIDFGVFITGRTGAGKSELAALAQQHFGPALTARNLPASWSSTANALEEQAFLATDAVLVVDDFCPTGTKLDVDKMHSAAERLFRATGNGSARGRLTRDATLRAARRPRSLVLATGEDVPRNHSLRARLVIVDVAAKDLRWDQLTPLQTQAADGTLAAAMAAYITYLIAQPSAFEHAAERVRALRKQLHGSSHPRTTDALTQLAYGWETFLRFASDVNAITSAKHDRLWTTVLEALDHLGAIQQQYQSTADPVDHFLTLLQSALTTGMAHIDAPNGDEPQFGQAFGWCGSGRGECIGWVDGDDLYLDPTTAYRVARKADITQTLVIGEQTLWKRFHDRGLLKTIDIAGRTNKVRRTLAGVKDRRVLHLVTDTLVKVDPEIANEPNDDDFEDAEAWRLLGPLAKSRPIADKPDGGNTDMNTIDTEVER